MSCRGVLSVKGALLSAAAFLLLSPPAQAGKQSTLPTWPPPPNHHVATASVVHGRAAAVTVAVAVTPPQTAKEIVYVNLRGPDGQVRRFPVEGGRESIQAPQVIVLRPGATVTVRWVVSK
ncbi:MAG TPA: hypothetical protein VFE78_05170 [Gemmataceae bacterium]|nr:hypothetical protein [Gemmataceae bacterium]